MNFMLVGISVLKENCMTVLGWQYIEIMVHSLSAMYRTVSLMSQTAVVVNASGNVQQVSCILTQASHYYWHKFWVICGWDFLLWPINHDCHFLLWPCKDEVRKILIWLPNVRLSSRSVGFAGNVMNTNVLIVGSHPTKKMQNLNCICTNW